MFTLVVLSVFLAQAPVEVRPACDADTVGLMWPNEANLSAAALHRLARNGELWICSKAPWRYKWERPSISVSQLKKEREEKAKRPVTTVGEWRHLTVGHNPVRKRGAPAQTP